MTRKNDEKQNKKLRSKQYEEQEAIIGRDM